jgi:DtxR family Mn-dependent transcriptional regulator
MSDLIENIEEILERLWISKKEKNKGSLALNVLGTQKNSDEIKELIAKKYITVEEETASLTEDGLEKGENVVRRHRLAEKLLVDVVDVSGAAIHDTACKLEHYLKEGIEDKICTLLGHPKECPHGKHIPAGPCCKMGIKVGEKYVIPLSQLKFGQKGKIAYIQGIAQKNLQSLSSMGILPGVKIVVKQTFPSCLFEIGNSEFAVDKDIAEAVYVRVEWD